MGVVYEWLKLAWRLPASFCRCLRCPRNCQGGQEEGKQAPSHLPLFQAERLCLCRVGKWWAKDWNRRRGLLLERTIVNTFESFRWSPTLSWSRNWGPENLNATFQFPQGGCDRARTRPHSCNSHPCSPHCAHFLRRLDSDRAVKGGRRWMGREDGERLTDGGPRRARVWRRMQVTLPGLSRKELFD